MIKLSFRFTFPSLKLSDYLIFKQTFLVPVGVLPHGKVKIKVMFSIKQKSTFILFFLLKQRTKRKKKREKTVKQEKRQQKKENAVKEKFCKTERKLNGYQTFKF